MKLSKIEVRILYEIDEGINGSDLLAPIFRITEKEAKQIFLGFEKKALIKIERRYNEIYQAILTDKGKACLKEYTDRIKD